MKTLSLKSSLLILITLVCLTLVSCSKDDDPVIDPGTEVTTIPSSSLTSYSGSLNYTGSNGQVVNSINGVATIEKDGSAYRITFSDNVPGLGNLIFENTDGEYTSLNSSGSMSGIVIDGEDLDIGVIHDGSSWSFSGAK